MSDIQSKKIRVRYPPSPTGFMHIGTLRTLLYNYLFARQNDGEIILRIEDTDQSRKVDGAVENLLDLIAWAGIAHDDGPYFQSERLPLYQEHAQKLLDAGHAYYCFCTPERLDAVRKEMQAAKKPPMYDRHCHALDATEVSERLAADEKHVIRMYVPRGEEITFSDMIRGDITMHTDVLDDQVLMKSDGFPTYHLAVVVDDTAMGITHVIRGEEWLSSTPKHVLLYRMFDFDLPQFAHLPLLLNKDKSKLSKRQGDVSVEDYITKGYLRDALINFVAFLGWNPGQGSTQELFSIAELLEEFKIEKVHKSGAVVDIERLDWINAQYIKKLSVSALYDHALPFLEKKDFYDADQHDAAFVKRVLAVEQERLVTLDDGGEENLFFFEDIVAEKELVRWKKNTDEETRTALEKAHDVLAAIDSEAWTRENLEKELMEAAGEKRGDFLWPIRAALTGADRSPSPFDCAWVLGKEEALKRIADAVKVFA